VTNPKPMRLVRGEQETRQERAMREIRERQKDAPFGMKTVDAQPTKNYLQVDEILRRSYRAVDPVE